VTPAERRAYARGLRAAARKLRREVAWYEAAARKADGDKGIAPPDWRNTCYGRGYALKEVAHWCERRAREVLRGKR